MLFIGPRDIVCLVGFFSVGEFRVIIMHAPIQVEVKKESYKL